MTAAFAEGLFDAAPLIEIPRPSAPPGKASALELVRCDPARARRCVAAWHSRLPVTQASPWMLAFVAVHDGEPYGGALWNNPSSRMLPSEWLELRRLAVPDYAPPHTASWMLGAMRRWIRTNLPAVPRLLSYQDTEVHKGTIYKAAGWELAYAPKPIRRNRGDVRVGTQRLYRTSLNGDAPDASAKVRWEVTP